MVCRSETVRTWYDLIRSALEQDAVRTALSEVQSQVLMANLKKEKIFPES